MTEPVRVYRLARSVCLALAAAGVCAAAETTLGGDFPAAIRKRAAESYWRERNALPPLSRKMLVDSIELARAYYLNHQLPEGNFAYGQNVTDNTADDDDSQVRQAGALWGLTSLDRDRHTDATRQAAVRGLDYFFRVSKPLPLGRVAPVYPKSDEISTGAVALLSLAIVEMCRGQKDYLTPAGRGLYESWFDTYLRYLQHFELDDGGWGQRYVISLNKRDAEGSSYYNGEALLLYCKAARYMGRKELIPKIERIAPLLAERYTVKAWETDPRSDDTKGFGHWGCLSFAECVEAGWQGADTLGDAALAIAWWLLHEHDVESRPGSTGYAVEGLLGAYRVARVRGDAAAMQSLRAAAERILVRQIRCQIGGPLQDQNLFLARARIHPKFIGGIMSTEDSGYVRIDTVQHQLHAMLMALELFFPETSPSPPATQPQPARAP